MVSLQGDEETPGAAVSFKMQAYLALKGSIMEMDIYGQRGEIRIDDREVCQMLGISRTPVREALILLEHEGFVRTVPRHGVVVARKSRTEIADMILVWAALEGMAARLAAVKADEADLIRLAERFPPGPDQTPDRTADLHQSLHQSLVQLSNCALIGNLTRNLALHMRAIHRLERVDEAKAAQATAMRDALIAALIIRDGEQAERLILEHHFDLNRHIQRTCDFLD
jgi:DNA-binding GntR family transcriptional regulator